MSARRRNSFSSFVNFGATTLFLAENQDPILEIIVIKTWSSPSINHSTRETHETNEEQTRTLLLANLLAFHEQKRAFHTKSEAMARYHLADPLWVVVGSTVNLRIRKAGTEGWASRSDRR